jgi:PTH1 family peptidyl-tRNA hydrolase
MADYVLRAFPPAEWEQVGPVLDTALEAVLRYCREGIDAAIARLHAR